MSLWWIAIPVGYAAVGFFAWSLGRAAKEPTRPEGDRRAR